LDEREIDAALSEPSDKPTSDGWEPAAGEAQTDAPPAKGKTLEPVPLTMRAVVDGVRNQAEALLPCLQQAVASGELKPDKPYRLVLTWEITPEGDVVAPHLSGPAELKDTELWRCVPRQMRAWKFPESEAGVSVRNYPFGPFSIR
jgi:hypothetical protein